MSADIFVYLDTVQFSKNGLQNRNQIKTASGAHWITVPVKHRFGQSIFETEIADRKTLTKHWKTIQANYSHSVGFRRWKDELVKIFESDHRSLAELTIATTEWMLGKLVVPTRRVRASELPKTEANASKLIAGICRHLGATNYLTGTGALAYMDLSDFSQIECEVFVQQWNSFNYQQLNDTFVADLSTLDLLLNCPDQASELIENAGSWKRLA